MKGRVFIVHGWGGSPNEAWIPETKRELERAGFSVNALKMPETNLPNPDKWTDFIKISAGKTDENTYFIGHSIGCLAILKHLQGENTKAGGCVLVAPYLALPSTDEDGTVKKVHEEWRETRLDFGKIKNLSRFSAVFSDDDPCVPLDETKALMEKIGAKIIIEKGKGHFGRSDGIKSLPVVSEEVIGFTT
jgi:hypothetical protein